VSRGVQSNDWLTSPDTGELKVIALRLTNNQQLLTPHSSLLTSHSSPLTPHPSLLTPHSSPLTPHPSFLFPLSRFLRFDLAFQNNHFWSNDRTACQ
jgi:hypothetical protein